jgi:hypothetical protein
MAPGAYGHDLLAEGVSCGLHRIERLMRQHGLKARPRRRRLPPDLGERQASAVAPNVLDRAFVAPAPNRRWIADFTYIWTAEGWLYVAAVVDLFSRRVVGWSMSAAMTAQLVTDALVMAIWRRGKPDALSTTRIAAANTPASSSSGCHPNRVRTTHCIGLTQVGPEIPQLLHLSRREFLDLMADKQIAAYGRWLRYYKFEDKMDEHGIDVGGMPLERQAAVLQAMQFAPNGEAWKVALSKGDFSVRSTRSKQAEFLGDTSIGDMQTYYGVFFAEHPPQYGKV